MNLAIRQSFLTLKNGDGAYVTSLVFYAISGLSAWPIRRRGTPRGRMNTARWNSLPKTDGGRRRIAAEPADLFLCNGYLR